MEEVVEVVDVELEEIESTDTRGAGLSLRVSSASFSCARCGASGRGERRGGSSGDDDGGSGGGGGGQWPEA